MRKGQTKNVRFSYNKFEEKKMAAMLSAKRANQKKANACLISQT